MTLQTVFRQDTCVAMKPTEEELERASKIYPHIYKRCVGDELATIELIKLMHHMDFHSQWHQNVS